jgi:hypothetical protein
MGSMGASRPGEVDDSQLVEVMGSASTHVVKGESVQKAALHRALEQEAVARGRASRQWTAFLDSFWLAARVVYLAWIHLQLAVARALVVYLYGPVISELSAPHDAIFFEDVVITIVYRRETDCPDNMRRRRLKIDQMVQVHVALEAIRAMVASWRIRRYSKSLSTLRLPALLNGVGWVGGDAAAKGDPWFDPEVLDTVKRGDRLEITATQQRLRDDNLRLRQMARAATGAPNKQRVVEQIKVQQFARDERRELYPSCLLPVPSLALACCQSLPSLLRAANSFPRCARRRLCAA